MDSAAGTINSSGTGPGMADGLHKYFLLVKHLQGWEIEDGNKCKDKRNFKKPKEVHGA